ncbi:MAG: nucleotidyl transferase AbiEii/AbiGii toxin family protein [Planctomycetes bacterium]|nr:nucleotidyl transferase AbiEii/AbiGii toxin family protein [Planctomycetota bacterium]
MDAYLGLSRARRRLLCEQASAQLALLPASVEKDFWVCWTLRELFALPSMGAILTFKGGTSLSKGWRLIQRFSEDLDVVIARSHLGFGGEASPERAASGKERSRRLDALQQRCREFVANDLLPALSGGVSRRLPKPSNWSLVLDADDPDGQTVLFTYPTEFGRDAYVRPVVKIELGARSDTEPLERPSILAYVAEAFPSALPDASFPVPTVAPVRTFWEKAMLLHEERFRSSGTGPKPRLSRHYYDLGCLIAKGVGARAAADIALFEAVAAHRSVFFRKSQKARESLSRGTLRLLPRDEHLDAWRSDYEAMREAMFLDTPPSFDELLERIAEFERDFNAGL